MNDNFAIDQLVEQIASSGRIKSFYPISISKKLNLPISTVLNRLNYLVDGGLLSLKYEIRCADHLTELGVVDSYDKVLGTYINCYECNDEIMIGLENIFVVYYLNNEYVESVKKKICSGKKLFKDLEIDNTPQNITSIIQDIVGQKEQNRFEYIESMDRNLAQIAEILANSGDKDIKNNFKEIDGEIKEHKRQGILSRTLNVSENIGKLKDGAEGVEKFYPHIVSTINFAMSTWPQIEQYLGGLLKLFQ